MPNKVNNFTFCVLTYNHSDYIIEHLESIKYQVKKYGRGVDCSLIINDDASKDDTVIKIEGWLVKNSKLFKSVKKIVNNANVGTCQSVINIVKALDTDFCKITAGDDVYTFNNIFDFISKDTNYSLTSGIPLRVVDGVVKVSFFEVFNYFASDQIYKNEPLLKRLANLSIVNAPNLFYSVKYLRNKRVLEFLKRFDVVEDLPLQVAIAEADSQSKLVSTKVPIVFYRRTPGSAYLVASKRFNNDQVKMFEYLIDLHSKRGQNFQVFLLKNRKYLFISKQNPLKALLNFSKYIYLFKLVYHLPSIIREYRNFKLNLKDYQAYFEEVRLASVCSEIETYES